MEVICCDTATDSAIKGHLNCFIHNFNLIEIVESDGFATIIAKHAIRNGNLNCLEYLTDNGYLCDYQSLAVAAGNGHLNCLEHIFNIGIPLHSSIISAAAEYGRLDCLIFAFENKCPWEEPSVIHPNVKEFLNEVSDNWKHDIFPNYIKG